MGAVTIGSVLLHDKRLPGVVADEFGVKWGLTKLEGWDDGWEGSGTVDQKSQADGAWISPQYAGPRVVHVGGLIEAESFDAVTLAWDRLLGQVPFRSLASLGVAVGDGSVPDRSALVRQHEKPLLNRPTLRTGEFSLSLLAPDPRKYATFAQSVNLVLPFTSGGIAPPLTPPLTVTGSSSLSQATVTNSGNVLTYPTLTVVGPCPPARIANLTTSEVIRVVDPVLAGESLVIDVLNGTATINGQSRRVLGSWWGLVPGANEVAFAADGYDADAELSMSFRSAWK